MLMILWLKEKREELTLSKLELLTMENGSVDSETGTVSNNGLMAQGTRDTGKIIGLMEKVNSLILMVTFMMATGSMIKPTAMAFTIISMVLCMRVSGEMIFNMEKEKNLGLINLCTKVNTWPVKNTDLVSIPGMMAQDIKENGMKIKSKGLELTVG
jgi:hypothetical protein